MGRAYEVRKASIQKTGAAKAKVYSMYAREIYQAAKKGTEVESNIELKRLIDKAKKDQVPSDIIKRAIDKVNSGIGEDYQKVRYDLFGPSGSTLVVDALTDNVNRTVSNIRTVVNKMHIKLGALNSVSYNYDNLAVVSFKELNEEEAMDLMINNNIDIDDIEVEDDIITIYGNPNDLYAIKEALLSSKPNLEFIVDEITMIPKDMVKLEKEDLEIFNKTVEMLDEIEDVQNIYHNVEM